MVAEPWPVRKTGPGEGAGERHHALWNIGVPIARLFISVGPEPRGSPKGSSPGGCVMRFRAGVVPLIVLVLATQVAAGTRPTKPRFDIRASAAPIYPRMQC